MTLARPNAGHAPALGSLQGVEHVLGLAGLADEQAHVLVIDCRGVLGDELRRQHGDGRLAGDLGEVDRPCQAGVVARPAADEVQVAGRPHLVEHRPDLGAALQHVQHLARHLGLLVDLLEHEVGIAAFLDGVHRLGDRFRLPLDDRCHP